jgi:hypothetical protein
MLCNVVTNIGGDITGVGPSVLPWSRCVAACCYKEVKLQIRTRYKTGTARLCAGFYDATDPDTFYVTSTTTTTYHKFASGSPIGDCTETVVLNDGPNAIVSGVDTLPDCDGLAPDISSPGDCMDHLWDPPTDNVTSDPPVNTLSGSSGTKDGTRSAAISAMAYGDWSEWTDIATIDLSQGEATVGYASIFLSESSISDNGASGGGDLGFTVSANQYESELRIMGPGPLSIAVSEGTDLATATVNRYRLEPNTPMLFSVSGPSIASGWVTPKKVLRCACPVQFAAT